MTNAELTRLDGATLLSQALAGCDDSAGMILKRYKKSIAKRGADHKQTERLAGMLAQIGEQRADAADAHAVGDTVESTPEVTPEVTADDIVASVLARKAAAPPKRPVRRFTADTIAAYRLMDEHGLTAGEVAEFMDKTEGTVRNAVTRVRKALTAGDDIIWG